MSRCPFSTVLACDWGLIADTFLFLSPYIQMTTKPYRFSLLDVSWVGSLPSILTFSLQAQTPITFPTTPPSKSHFPSLSLAVHTTSEGLLWNSVLGLSPILNFCKVFEMNCCSLSLKDECALQMNQTFNSGSHLAILTVKGSIRALDKLVGACPGQKVAPKVKSSWSLWLWPCLEMGCLQMSSS